MKSKFSTLIFILTAVCLTGCVSKKAADEQARQAYQTGFQQGQAAAALSRTHVFVTGPVQHQQVVWHPELTVAQTIVEAVYTAPNDPTSIVVVRDGIPNSIDPQNLLRGIDFPLKPGDTIQVFP